MNRGERLTERQRRFVEAYSANGGNAMGAARKAGYAAPKQEGARLLENAVIRNTLEMLRLATTNAAIATREDRQSFWTRVMRGEEPAEYRDRLKASELLGKTQGDFIVHVDATTRVIVERRDEDRIAGTGCLK